MRFLFAVMLALAPVAAAQTPSVPQAPAVPQTGAPQTFQFPKPFNSDAILKALANRALTHGGQVVILSQMAPVERPCAVPLLEYKADPSIDPKMAIRLPKSGEGDARPLNDRSIIRMPLPVCTTQH